MTKLKCSICKNQYSLEKKWLSNEDTEGCVMCPDCYEKGVICGYCHRALTGGEKESPREDSDGDVMCDDCYDEHYMFHCELCEDTHCNDEDYYFAITKSLIDDKNITYNGRAMLPGIYKPIKIPFYSDELVFGFQCFHDDSLKLIKEIDFDKDWYFCDRVRQDCVDKHTRLSSNQEAKP